MASLGEVSKCCPPQPIIIIPYILTNVKDYFENFYFTYKPFGHSKCCNHQ